MSPCLLESPSQSQRWGNDDNDDSNDDNETQVSIPDETVKFSYDQQRQYILFQGTEVAQWSTSQVSPLTWKWVGEPGSSLSGGGDKPPPPTFWP